MECPEAEVLSAFCRNHGLDPDERRALERHFDGCSSCGHVVAELVRIYSTDVPSGCSPDPLDGSSHGRGDHDADTLHGADAPEPGIPQLASGTRLDRYHILDVVGRGGMGVVYAAYDPDLDRKVALKVLHERDESDDEPANELAQRRLLREAQAMAKLSHPNVITVHEARVADGRVFLSMEFVDGGTLGRWLVTRSPDMARVLAMFRDIGRGLAAAHAAGLVHRDVKPDNVLVGSDERPRVTDFGLARPAESVPALAESGTIIDVARLHEGDRGRLSATLSRAGVLVGTPAYMSPEQLLREPATAASDQFAFCVALFEALYGVRPFEGRNLIELAISVVSGTLREPERDPGVPRWLRQVVLRGLSRRPEDRWPSMEVLVERLAPPRRHRRVAWLALGAIVLGGGALASRSLLATSDPCARGTTIVEERWGPGPRADVLRALGRGDSAYAETSAALAIERLDAYAGAWAEGHRDACEDYHRGAQSHEAFDLRAACLDEHMRALEALIAVFAEADAEVQRHALAAIDDLPPLGTCADVQALRTRVPLPEDPAARARVAALEVERAQAEALLRAGRYSDGLVRMDVIVADARDAGHAPMLARALRDRAELRRRQRQREAAASDFREAWLLALGAGDDAVAAECMVGHVLELAAMRRFDEATQRAEDATALIERVMRHDPQRAEELGTNLDEARGEIQLRQHHYADAAVLFERAQERVESRFGPDTLRAAQSLSLLGSVRVPQGELNDALALFERVLEIRTKLLGPAHPEAASTRNNIGLTLKNMGRLEEAAAQLEQSRAIASAALGATHPLVRTAEINLADVYYKQERFGEAADLYDATLDLAGEGAIADTYELERALRYGLSLAHAGRSSDARDVLALAEARATALGDPAAVALVEETRAALSRVPTVPD